MTVEYQIALDRRDGAFQWGVVEDTSQPGVYLEYFLTASWLEHLRQHERVTNDDRGLQEAIGALHIGSSAPQLRHFVGGSPAERMTQAPNDSAAI